MSLQYISDNNGLTTGVFIPIEEWNELKNRFKGLENELKIPEWHLKELDLRLDSYNRNSSQSLDFESSMDSLEKDL